MGFRQARFKRKKEPKGRGLIPLREPRSLQIFTNLIRLRAWNTKYITAPPQMPISPRMSRPEKPSFNALNSFLIKGASNIRLSSKNFRTRKCCVS